MVEIPLERWLSGCHLDRVSILAQLIHGWGSLELYRPKRSELLSFIDFYKKHGIGVLGYALSGDTLFVMLFNPYCSERPLVIARHRVDKRSTGYGDVVLLGPAPLEALVWRTNVRAIDTLPPPERWRAPPGSARILSKLRPEFERVLLAALERLVKVHQELLAERDVERRAILVMEREAMEKLARIIHRLYQRSRRQPLEGALQQLLQRQSIDVVEAARLLARLREGKLLPT